MKSTLHGKEPEKEVEEQISLACILVMAYISTCGLKPKSVRPSVHKTVK